MGFLFSDNKYPSVTTSSTSSIPKWLQDYQAAALKKADVALDAPYQAYTGPRVAGLTPDQQSAYNLTRSTVGQYNPMIAQGGADLTSGGTAVSGADINNYLNPYTSAVTDQIAQLGGRNLSENLLPAVNDTFIRGGQFGGTQNSDFTLRALRDTNDDILRQQSTALQSGYNTALNAAQQQKQNQIQAGTQLGNLAATGQGVNLKDAASLQSIGQEQQGQTQKSYDQAYQDFLEQKNYPLQQAETSLSLIQGAPTNQTTTTTSPGTAANQQPSTLGSLVGAGASVLGGLLSSGIFSAKGGPVKAKRRVAKVPASNAQKQTPAVRRPKAPSAPDLTSVIPMAPRMASRGQAPTGGQRPNLSALRQAA